MQEKCSAFVLNLMFTKIWVQGLSSMPDVDMAIFLGLIQSDYRVEPTSILGHGLHDVNNFAGKGRYPRRRSTGWSRGRPRLK